VINTTSDDSLEVSEQDMFDRERAAFLKLAKTPQTKRWINAMLSGAEID
jgi:3-hydroxyacyl-CoA dehydrogenase